MVVIAAAGWMGAGVAHAAGGSVTGVSGGSWWEGQPSGGTLPAPATVPAHGLWVSSSVLGPTAESAVRFTLTGAAAPVLRLEVHEAQPASAVAIVGCEATPASAGWKAVTAGPWAARPDGDCSTAATGVLSADGTTLTMDLSGLPIPQHGTYDVVLEAVSEVPLGGVAALPEEPPTFDATFDAFEAADVAATPSRIGSSSPAPRVAPVAAVSAAPAPASSDNAVLLAPPEVLPAVSGGSAVLTAPAPPKITLANPSPTLAPAPAAVTLHNPVARAVSGLSRRVRWLLAMVVLDLALFASWQGWFEPGRRRPRVTLYDDPASSAVAPVRTGRAPSLR